MRRRNFLAAAIVAPAATLAGAKEEIVVTGTFEPEGRKQICMDDEKKSCNASREMWQGRKLGDKFTVTFHKDGLVLQFVD